MGFELTILALWGRNALKCIVVSSSNVSSLADFTGRAVVVAALAEGKLPTSEERGSSPVIDQFYKILVTLNSI